MPTSAQVPGGIVSHLQGRAHVIPAGETQARALSVGDVIQPGDKVLAEQDTEIHVRDGGGQDWLPSDMVVAMAGDVQLAARTSGKRHHKHAADVDEAIKGLNEGKEEDATAAGLGGGGGGSLGLGFRVDRVIETVSPQEFSYDTALRDAGTPFAVTAASSDTASKPGNRSPFIDDPDNPNYKPEAGRYAVTTDEDTAVSGRVRATDPDGDALSYGKGADPLHGTVVVNPDGTWTYTPNRDYNGADSFTITVSDGEGGLATAIVDIGITPVNDPPKVVDPDNPDFDPVAGKYLLTTDEDTPVSGRVRATDADGDPLSYAPGQAPQHGTVEIQPDGSWTYTPAQDYNGSDRFTVIVSDGHGGTATAVVDIGVLPVNDAPKVIYPDIDHHDPVAGGYRYDTDEDTPVSGRVQATDVDGDLLTYTLDGQPQHGTVIVNKDGTWSYMPSANYNGEDRFTVLVDDGHGGTAVATVNIGVGDANDPPKIDDPDSPDYDPVAGKYVVTTDEDTPVNGQVKASDQDGDALTYAAGQAPQHGTVVVNANGTWTYTPTKDYNGPDAFTVLVSDGHGGTATALVEIGVQPVNDAPKVIDPDSGNFDPITGQYSYDTEEDTPVSGQVKATDVDGDTLTYSAQGLPQHGTVVVNADGTWTYTPGNNFSGNDRFTVLVDDGHGGTALATVNIGVGDANDPPKIDDPDSPDYDPVAGKYVVTTDEDTPVNGQVKASDQDGDVLTYAAGQAPQHGSVIVNADGTWTYTPTQDYNGPDSFTVIVSDGHGGTATALVEIGVQPVNDAPKVIDPDSGNFDPITGQYSYDTEEDTPVSGQVKATDVDGDTLTYSAQGQPQHGTVVVNVDGTWTYTPGNNFSGNDRFTVLVDDGHGGTALATVNIGVGDANDPPKIDDPGNPHYNPETGTYTVTTDEDTPVNGQVKASDQDGDVLTYAAGQAPQHGSVTVNPDGTWTYTPTQDYNGPDSFTVLVSDGHGGTATALVEIGVQPVNDAPKVIDPDSGNFDPITGQYSYDTEEDTPVSGQVKATDVDGDTLTYSAQGLPQHGTVVVNADGTWTYTPGNNFSGNDRFTVLVDDGHGGTAIATVNIGVGDANDPPKIDDPGNPHYDPEAGKYSVLTDEDTPVDGRVKATDLDGDALTYAAGQAPQHGTVTVNTDGTWTYTPATDYNGPDSFTVIVSDGRGGTATATIDIGVQPVNDAPRIHIADQAIGISEEGLAGGNADNQGSSDTGDSRTAEGAITFSDAEGQALTATLSGPAGLTSGGVPITWQGAGTTADPLIGSAGSRPIVTATIDNQGHYKLTLSGPVDHADTQTEDVRALNLQVHVSDGQATSTSTLAFHVEDDSPLSGTQVMQVSATAGTQNTNLMLIIDTSGSMKEELADKTSSGIKAAIKSLIDRYDTLGDVKIQIVTFSDAAQGRAAWLTVAQAKTFVDALSSQNGTNYDAALAAARASFTTPGKLADGVNVSYFITDGQPNKGKGLDSSDESTWEKFVNDNRIDSYAIGTGTLTAQHISNIEPVAYNGIAHTERPAVTLATNQELSKYLLDSVPTLKAGSLASLAGADGLQVVEAFTSSKQVSSSLDANTKILTVTLQSGTEIRLNTVTGEFSMKQGPSGGDETFSYTLVDKDGDRSSGTVILHSEGGGTSTPTINHGPQVFAVNEGQNILDLVDLSVNPLLDLSKSQHVAVQDVDNNLVRVDVSVDQMLSLGSLLGDKSELHVSLDPALTQGLHITGDGTRHLVIESQTQGGHVDIAQVNKLLATLSYDPATVFGSLSLELFPKLTIKATDAAGASDSKSISSSIIAVEADLSFGASTPTSASTHHDDSEVFSWSLADAPAPSSHPHIDTICDFNGAAPSSGGDVLDLRDLLHVDSGTQAGTQTVDKLLNFLDFDTQSQPGSTIIHISSSGGFQADTVHGDSHSTGCTDQQQIVLANVDIRSSLGLDAHANDHQIISELVQRGKLLVDH